eukprot:4451400-Prymnesium_polylepis.1
MQIVGYYQANEFANDPDLGPFGKRITDKIRSRCAAAATLLVRRANTHHSSRAHQSWRAPRAALSAIAPRE